jgi:hypothetical protein
MSRILALMPCSLELDGPSSTAAMMASKCFSILRSRLPKAGMRLRFADVHHRFR